MEDSQENYSQVKKEESTIRYRKVAEWEFFFVQNDRIKKKGRKIPKEL